MTRKQRNKILKKYAIPVWKVKIVLLWNCFLEGLKIKLY